MSVFFACVMTVLLLFCGLSIDVGMMEWQKTRMQSAADAAALAAQIAHDREDTDWQVQGQQDAALNGFTDGASGVSVQITVAPAYGDFTNFYDAVVVTITQPMNTAFMKLIKINTVMVKAQSTSLLTPCVYLLGTKTPSSPSLLLLNQSSIGYYGGSTMGCPVDVAYSLTSDSASSVWTDAMNVTGNSAASVMSGAVFHQPRFNAKTVSDPLAYLTQPSSPNSASCNYSGASYSGVTTTINPGVYCGGLTIRNSNITLNPGLYTITGGAQIFHSTVSGASVTLFLTSMSGSSNYGQFVAQLSQLSLSAGPTSVNGSIPTVLLFADRNWVQSSPYDIQFLSGTTLGDGVYYVPACGMEFYVNAFGNAIKYHSVVANSLELISTAYSPKSDFSSVPTGNPFNPPSGLVQ